MTRPRLLFVDDEPNILNGLKRLLRGSRREWDISFANSAEEALALVDGDPVDVVISDVKMPRIDGTALLEALRDRHPRIIRFILSGQCDEDGIYRLIHSSHQFFSKPCNHEALLAGLRRTLSYRALVPSDGLRRLVAGLAILPSPTAVRAELEDALASGRSQGDTLTEIAGRDPALCLKLLQLSCSAFFGVGGGVSTPRRALERLGTDTVRALVTHHDIVPASPDFPAFRAARQRCVDAANRAETLAAEDGLDPEDVALAATAGLLSQIGAMVLALDAPQEYGRIIAGTATDPAARRVCEEEAFGASQSALGGYLLSLWGLPEGLVALACGRAGQPPGGADERLADIVDEAVFSAGAHPSIVPVPETNGHRHDFQPIADRAQKGALSS